MLMSRCSWFSIVVLSLTILSACQKDELVEAPPQEESLQPGEYRLTGKVIQKVEERNRILVQHDEIEGFMPAMTMEFGVGSGDLSMVQPDMTIRAILYQNEEGFHLREIWPYQSDDVEVLESVREDLEHDVENRGLRVYRDIGEAAPPFALYNQDGELAQPSSFAGQRMVINFVFTRCPDANMCPLSVSKMIELQRKAKELAVSDLQLLSISLDPEYDTPGILKAYVDVRGIDTSNYQFLTGPLDQVELLLRQLGVSRFVDGSVINHSMNTLLIDASGKIAYLEEKSDWSPEAFLARLQ